jgi:serine/threonine protein kinase
MPLLEEGEQIHGTYEVERFLGEGAFAEVYRVKHRFLGRQAMKVFKRVGMTVPEIEEMLGEAILLSRIGHPNIVRVFDANVLETKDGLCGYFTMEHIAGGSLERFWRSHGNAFVPVVTSVELISQVCRGIDLAHRESPPIIHRDIKPQNILVGYEVDGLRARVSDFGLAKKVNPLTLLATAAGTVAFKPPEAFADARSDSCAGDVWALGTTLYLLLTDRLPFELPSELGWGSGFIPSKPLVAPSAINPEVDAGLDRVVARALQLQPKDRYPTAGELLEAITRRVASHSMGRPDKSSLSSELTKSRLSPASSPVDPQLAAELVAKALALVKGGLRLNEAADLMEEAFNRRPELRHKYADKVKLWRRGVAM